MMIRVKSRVFMVFAFLPYGGGCTWGTLEVGQFCTQRSAVEHYRDSFLVPKYLQ